PGSGAGIDARPAVRIAAHQQGAVVAHGEKAAVVVGDEVQVLARGRCTLEPLGRVGRGGDAPTIADTDEHFGTVREGACAAAARYRGLAVDPVDAVVAAQSRGVRPDRQSCLLEMVEVAGPAGVVVDRMEVRGKARVYWLLQPVDDVEAGMDGGR